MTRKQEDNLVKYESGAVSLKELTVRVLGGDEFERAGRYFDEEHYLGDLSTGRHLLQVVEHKGRWMALLDWGASAHRLEDRDRWIGWTGGMADGNSCSTIWIRVGPFPGS